MVLSPQRLAPLFLVVVRRNRDVGYTGALGCFENYDQYFVGRFLIRLNHDRTLGVFCVQPFDNVAHIKKDTDLDSLREEAAFKEIVAGSSTTGDLHYEMGNGGRVLGSSSSFRWVTVSR